MTDLSVREKLFWCSAWPESSPAAGSSSAVVGIRSDLPRSGSALSGVGEAGFAVVVELRRSPAPPASFGCRASTDAGSRGWTVSSPTRVEEPRDYGVVRWAVGLAAGSP